MTDEKPTQVTLGGAVKTRVGHSQHDECDVYIGRDRRDGELKHMGNTPIGERGWLGNPFPLDEGYTREESIELFREAFEERLDEDSEFRSAIAELQGVRLGCWCQRLDADGPACHGEVIAEWVDRFAGTE